MHTLKCIWGPNISAAVTWRCGVGLPAVWSLVGKKGGCVFSPSRPAVLQKPISSCKAHSSCPKTCPGANVVCRQLLHWTCNFLTEAPAGPSLLTEHCVYMHCMERQHPDLQSLSASLSPPPLSPVCLRSNRSPITPTGAQPGSGLRGPIRRRRTLTKLQESHFFLVSFSFLLSSVGPLRN